MKPSHRAAVLCIAVAAACSASAQGVFKCTKDGKTSYQSAPCEGGAGATVNIAPGPSQKELADAQMKATAEKNRAAEAQARHEQANQPPAPGLKPGLSMRPGVGTVDCSKLASDREQAYGRRNAGLHKGRQSTNPVSASSADSTVDQANAQIQSIESRMRAGGCKVPL